MTTIACPWCQADEPVDPALLVLVGEFECPECCTRVRLVDPDAGVLDLAA